jgi:transcriptional/translational regulatory protein YebC/TACO1
MKQLGAVRDAIKASGLEVIDAELQYVPNQTITIDQPETARKIIKLMDAIEELDDISNTFSNFDIDESLLQ